MGPNRFIDEFTTGYGEALIKMSDRPAGDAPPATQVLYALERLTAQAINMLDAYKKAPGKSIFDAGRCQEYADQATALYVQGLAMAKEAVR
jgi:hypothetical protein